MQRAEDENRELSGDENEDSDEDEGKTIITDDKISENWIYLVCFRWWN